MKTIPKHGDLRVWHVPQMPMQSFKVHVATLIEAKLLLDTLALYDQFQLDNNIKPDYCNASGLSVFDEADDHDGPDGSWVDWYTDDGDEIGDFSLEQIRNELPKWEGES